MRNTLINLSKFQISFILYFFALKGDLYSSSFFSLWLILYSSNKDIINFSKFFWVSFPQKNNFKKIHNISLSKFGFNSGFNKYQSCSINSTSSNFLISFFFSEASIIACNSDKSIWLFIFISCKLSLGLINSLIIFNSYKHWVILTIFNTILFSSFLPNFDIALLIFLFNLSFTIL